MIEIFAEYGTIGVVVILFSYMVMNIIKSLKSQDEDLDQLRQSMAKMDNEMSNVQGITIKLIDRFNSHDSQVDKRHESTNAARAQTMERFGNRIERLERTTLRLEGRILNGYKGATD